MWPVREVNYVDLPKTWLLALLACVEGADGVDFL
jgi:hypothetical protein